MKKNRPLPCYDIEKTVSATEMTGLIPFLPEDEAQAESYEALYPIHRQQITGVSPDPANSFQDLLNPNQQDSLFNQDR